MSRPSGESVIAANTERCDDAVWHRALLYQSRRQYVDGVLRFVHGALDSQRPVFVAVPGARESRAPWTNRSTPSTYCRLLW